MTPEFEKLYSEKALNLLNTDEINYIIKANSLDTNKISDGYHTFEQLYEHRITLYISLCKNHKAKTKVWRSKKHSDGIEWDGWFILGIDSRPGLQITYHLPISKWDDCYFAKELEQAPEFDGHTSEDVLNRIKNL